jgi:predicted PurR-regulated permease PerM
MLRAIEGVSVLLLLSAFFAYVLAPATAGLRRRVRIGRRRRPLSRASALLVLYAILFVPAALAWRLSADLVTEWVQVTAPASVDRLFGRNDFGALDRLIARVPLPPTSRPAIRQRLEAAVGYLEREARSTLNDLIAAAPHAVWLAVTPVIAFLLLTLAPGFRRSTLRVLPRGHLQWRAEEYLRDVNSALAGYVRAQAASGVIVGVLCVAGFALLRLPSAVSLGVAAGVLELVPAIGPLTAMLVAGTQAGDRVWEVIAFLGALRVAQDYVIYPRLVRRGMRMSTPAVILTIWFGAVFAGAAGVILAIPVAGFLSVSVRHWREYREIERLIDTAARQRSSADAER